jgi:hypothetical protein
MVLHSVDHPTTKSLVFAFTVHDSGGELLGGGPKNGATVLPPMSQHAEAVPMGFLLVGVSITFFHSVARLLVKSSDGWADAGAT